MGNSSNVPFLPAGFDDEVEVMLRFSDSQDQQQQSSSAAEEEPYLNFEGVLVRVPLAVSRFFLNIFHRQKFKIHEDFLLLFPFSLFISLKT